ncbi:MAG: hypothetical protein H0V01_14750 [Bacteroidetes bacterium]|nr:hypothetical protein [Bacteroidota bacterium]HET6242942.1 hypothetical protein [Bacteroidia bacterium]
MIQTRLATVISYLFHPLLMPTIGTFLIFNIGGYIAFTVTPTVKYMVYGIVFLNTFIFPSMASYYLLKKGYINSTGMATIQERRIPMALTAVFYFFTYYILRKATLPPVLFLVILGATLSVLLTLIITLVWKISAHMVGVGGIVGAVIGLSVMFSVNLQLLIMALILVAGLVGYSRLKLNAHSHLQVYVGFLLGLSSMLLLILGV